MRQTARKLATKHPRRIHTQTARCETLTIPSQLPKRKTTNKSNSREKCSICTCLAIKKQLRRPKHNHLRCICKTPAQAPSPIRSIPAPQSQELNRRCQTNSAYKPTTSSRRYVPPAQISTRSNSVRPDLTSHRSHGAQTSRHAPTDYSQLGTGDHRASRQKIPLQSQVASNMQKRFSIISSQQHTQE